MYAGRRKAAQRVGGGGGHPNGGWKINKSVLQVSSPFDLRDQGDDRLPSAFLPRILSQRQHDTWTGHTKSLTTSSFMAPCNSRVYNTTIPTIEHGLADRSIFILYPIEALQPQLVFIF